MNPDIKEMYAELESRTLKNDLIAENKTYFSVNNQLYYVQMPSPKFIHMAEDAKHKLFIELIKNKEELTKKNLKALLKETQNIDIDKLEIEKQKLQEEIHDLYLSLATKKDDDKNIQALKDKVQDLKESQMELSYNIANYLSSSIEDKIEKRYMETLTYLCTYIVDTESNRNVWTSFDDFSNDASILPEKAVMYLTYLLFNLRSN